MEEVWVICRVAAVVLHFEVFTGFVNSKPDFDDVTVFTFEKDDKSIQAMIYTSKKRAEDKAEEISRMEKDKVVYVVPLSTVIAVARAWR